MDDWNVAPVLVVRDVSESIAYYRDRMGFSVKGTFGEPLEMAFVSRGNVQLMLQDAEGKPTPGPNSRYKSVAWDVLFWVTDVYSLHSELSRLGAIVSGPPESTFYGTTEFQAKDPDDHTLCFCQLAGPAA